MMTFEPLTTKTIDEKLIGVMVGEVNHQGHEMEFITWVQLHWGDFLPKGNTSMELFQLLRKGRILKLPLSYVQLGDMFMTKDSIRDGLGVITSEEDLVEIARLQEEKDKARINQTGEMTLGAIGSVFGQITGTAIKNLGDAAQRKFKSFAVRVPGRNGELTTTGFDVDEDLWEKNTEEAVEIYLKILEHEINVAKNNPVPVEVVEVVKEDQFAWLDFLDGDDKEEKKEESVDKEIVFSPLDVLEGLKEAGYLTDNEVSLISDAEQVGIYFLMEEIHEGRKENARQLMVKDMDEEDNILSTLQNINAKIWFAPKKRGRPLGSKNKTSSDE